MRYLPIVIGVLFPFLLVGQQMFPLRSATDSIRFSVTSRDGQLVLEPAQPLRAGDSSFPAISGLRLEDGALVADYQYKGRLKKGLDYELQIAILPPSGLPMLPAPREVTDDRNKNNAGTLTWPDRTEQGLDYGKTYTLIVWKQLIGEVACDAGRPAFGPDKQWPYYAAALAGGTLIGLGQVYRQDKKEAYKRYRAAWRSGDSAEDAQPDLDEARSKDDTARLLTYIGIGLLAADAAGFAWRWGATKRRQNLYDEYCAKEGQPSLTMAPCIRSPGGPAGLFAGAGLRLQLQF